jgi:hypothetical protein
MDGFRTQLGHEREKYSSYLEVEEQVLASLLCPKQVIEPQASRGADMDRHWIQGGMGPKWLQVHSAAVCLYIAENE